MWRLLGAATDWAAGRYKLSWKRLFVSIILILYADDEGWSDYIAQAPDLIGSHLWCRLTLTHFSLQVDLSIFVKLEDESPQSFCSAESARRLQPGHCYSWI